jgi:hypothetical protein
MFVMMPSCEGVEWYNLAQKKGHIYMFVMMPISGNVFTS